VRGGWVAGVTRARLMLGRMIGADHARAVARCRSLDEGLGVLAGSAYGERAQVGLDLAAAERGVAETLLWHLQILAGWLPPGGAGLVRALAGWFELANTDARVAALVGGGREPSPFVLGGLATAWTRIEQARSVDQVADIVAGSAWGDPGGRTPAELSLGLRVAWARRVQDAAPGARDWVAGAAALLVARELLVAGTRAGAAALQRLPGIGEEALRAGSVAQLRASLPEQAAWAIQGISDPGELWGAELGWWRRVERDAPALLHTWGDEAVVLACVALLAVDAQRTVRALRAAAHGGSPEFVEMVDGAL
jgi:hypothetical protein